MEGREVIIRSSCVTEHDFKKRLKFINWRHNVELDENKTVFCCHPHQPPRRIQRGNANLSTATMGHNRKWGPIEAGRRISRERTRPSGAGGGTRGWNYPGGGSGGRNTVNNGKRELFVAKPCFWRLHRVSRSLHRQRTLAPLKRISYESRRTHNGDGMIKR